MSITSGSRQNGFVCRNRNISGRMGGLCEVSRNRVTIVTISLYGVVSRPVRGPAAIRSGLCYPASIDGFELAHIRWNGGLVLQRLGRNRVPSANQEVATSGRIYGPVLRHAGDQYVVLRAYQARMGQVVVP